MITPKIDTHYFYPVKIFDEPANPVGKIVHIDPPRPGAAALGKHEDCVPLREQVVALLQGQLHLLAVAAACDGDALHEVADGRVEGVAVEVALLGEVPGEPPVVQKGAPAGQHGKGDKRRIDKSQVVGANQPAPVVFAEMIPAALPEGLELPETVAHEPDNQHADRDEKDCGHAAQCVLNRQPHDIFLIHVQDPVPGTLYPDI
jgi:hypothetical protein